jgi:hypothetical protein
VVNLATWQVDLVVEELAYSPDGTLLATANNRDWERYAVSLLCRIWQVQPVGSSTTCLTTQWMNTCLLGGWAVACHRFEDAIDLWQVSVASAARV